MRQKLLLTRFALLVAMITGAGATAWAEDTYTELYSASFLGQSNYSYTQNKELTLSGKKWTISASQFSSSVFYLGVNSSNAAKGVLGNNSTFEAEDAILDATDEEYISKTTHAYAMLFANTYSEVSKISVEWTGGNNAFQVYLFGDSGSGYVLLSSTNYATSGTSEAGSVEWTGEATTFNKIAIIARPGTANSTATSKTIRMSSFKLYKKDATDNRADAGLIVEDDFNMEVTTTKDIEDIFAVDSEGAVTVSSRNTAVVNVEDGMLKALSVGTAVITVRVAETATHKPAEETINVTVTAKEAVAPVSPASTAGKFVKVTSTDDITDDGDYLIVYKTDEVAFDGSLSTLDAGNNVIPITIETDGTIKETTANKASIFTINATKGTVKSASGYYIGISSYSNGLKTTDDESAYTNSITIDDDENLLISKAFENGTMTLWFNANSGDSNYRFRFYKTLGTTNKSIQLYKYVPGTQDPTFSVNIGSAGYKTLVSSVDFKTPEGVTAYIVTATSSEEATLTAISKVPAGEPVILKGSDEVTLTVIDDANAVRGNLLQVSTENTGNGVYVLADKTSGVGFYKWAGGSLGAGRVYLPASEEAREFISFGKEYSGISNAGMETDTHKVIAYNLQGQRVATPGKGLYIVNGKKIIIK